MRHLHYDMQVVMSGCDVSCLFQAAVVGTRRCWLIRCWSVSSLGLVPMLLLSTAFIWTTVRWVAASCETLCTLEQPLNTWQSHFLEKLLVTFTRRQPCKCLRCVWRLTQHPVILLWSDTGLKVSLITFRATVLLFVSLSNNFRNWFIKC